MIYTTMALLREGKNCNRLSLVEYEAIKDAVGARYGRGKIPFGELTKAVGAGTAILALRVCLPEEERDALARDLSLSFAQQAAKIYLGRHPKDLRVQISLAALSEVVALGDRARQKDWVTARESVGQAVDEFPHKQGHGVLSRDYQAAATVKSAIRASAADAVCESMLHLNLVIVDGKEARDTFHEAVQHFCL